MLAVHFGGGGVGGEVNVGLRVLFFVIYELVHFIDIGLYFFYITAVHP